jgi:hypothetical protein
MFLVEPNRIVAPRQSHNLDQLCTAELAHAKDTHNAIPAKNLFDP